MSDERSDDKRRDPDHLEWLAGMIPAYGDYAKEAALYLRRYADEIRATPRCTCYLYPHADDCAIFGALTQDGERLPCGHHESLAVVSVESGATTCDLCDTRSRRNDAETNEHALLVERRVLQKICAERADEIERLKASPSATATPDPIVEAVRWVVNDANYKAPEQVGSVAWKWILRLRDALQRADSRKGEVHG